MGEYFYGKRKMRPVPNGISMAVSFMSSIALMGNPAEMYTHGYSYMIGAFAGSLGYFLFCVMVVHVLHSLKVTSLNQYLVDHFKSEKVGIAANLIVLACIFHYMGSCMLGSIVALTSATGGQISFIWGLVIGATVGIFYTTIGGLKAVVWTDVLQTGVMFIAIVVIIVKSILDTPGGMRGVVEMCKSYDRFHRPIWSLDPTIRLTMWNLLLGVFVDWGSIAGQPANIQRLCAIESKKDAYIASAVAGLLFAVLSILPSWAGLNIYGYYASRGCDIHAAGWIRPNEVIVYYVRDRLAVPGFQGLFVAALFAGSLSSLSSGLNCASAIIWKDTVQPLLPFRVTEGKATFISKACVVLLGVLGMIWCYVLDLFPGIILQVSSSTSSAMYVSYFAVFLNVILFRFTSIKGVLSGLFIGCGFTLWLGIGSLLHGSGSASFLPSTTETCDPNVTKAFQPPALIQKEIVEKGESVYSVSFLWLSVICLCVSILVNVIVSGCEKCYWRLTMYDMQAREQTECPQEMKEVSKNSIEFRRL